MYLPQADSACNQLCRRRRKSDKELCCDPTATCSCGTHTGHYACLCPKGHYGQGFIGDCTREIFNLFSPLESKVFNVSCTQKKFFLARVDFFRVMCLLCGCSMSLGNVQANTWARRQKVLHSVSQSWSNESLGKLGIISVPMQRRIHLTLRKVSN